MPHLFIFLIQTLFLFFYSIFLILKHWHRYVLYACSRVSSRFEFNFSVFKIYSQNVPMLNVLFLPTTWISFTKLRFRRSFLGTKQVWILFGSKVMTKMKNMQKYKNRIKRKKHLTQIFFLQNCRKPETEKNALFCHKFWTNWGTDPFNISKWSFEPQFCGI